MNTEASKNYYVTIGIECHAELKTKSKMWCNCANIPLEDAPNKNICEICTAQPGTLPVPNQEAIKHMIKIGMAVGADIANFTEFDRKHYFYADMPKAYQLTQYKYPIVEKGSINGIPLTRIHLEEDTAKSTHDAGNYTLVDFNRAGVPLMELVTDPVTYESKEDAAIASGNFGRELQRILRTLGASDADMEKGQMRVEANISVTKDKNVWGTKCEVKNLNSFRSMEEAIKFEVDRHIELIENSEKVEQQTRGWDENKRETFPQRKKENANDYRYFPCPDIPKLYLNEIFDFNAIRDSLPMLPAARKSKLSLIGLNEKQIEQLLNDSNLCDYYLKTIDGYDNGKAKIVANYLLSDIVGLLEKDNKLKIPSSNSLREVVDLISKNMLSSRAAKDIIAILLESDVYNEGEADSNKVEELANSKGLIQKNDVEALKNTINSIVANNAAQWEEYKAGNDKLIMFFVGLAMKESKGSGNPQMFIEIIKNLK